MLDTYAHANHQHESQRPYISPSDKCVLGDNMKYDLGHN